MTFYIMAWIFFIYALIGWFVEVIYYAGLEGRFINRGFLNGPLCPVYGIGVFIVTSLLQPMRENIILLFFASVLLTSTLELIVGFILDKLFKQRWWDYTDEPMNVGGYICLRFSLMWGIGCLIIVNIIHPIILKGINLIPEVLGYILLLIFIVAIMFDTVYTIMKIKKFSKGISQLDEIIRNVRMISDKIGATVADGTLAIIEKGELRERLDKIKDVQEHMKEKNDKHLEDLSKKLSELKKAQKESIQKFTKEHSRLLSAFPTLNSVKYKESIDKIKAAFKENRDKRNKR